jgi:SAM-dependent methyltransferase
MSYQYDSEFFDFVNASAGKSANLFIEALSKGVFSQNVSSVIDIGCGRGVWSAEWRKRGLQDVCGVDGDYVQKSSLLIPPENFLARDISKSFDVARRFDLVQCLEVAEHVPAEHAETLVSNIVRHGDVVLFSAAIPGQGGEFHVNERPYDYWRKQFAAKGYDMYDAVRAAVVSNSEIEPWYRYNAFIFANEAGAKRLSAAASAAKLGANQAIPDVSPMLWRMRCFTLSLFPASVTNAAARLKHRVANRAS